MNELIICMKLFENSNTLFTPLFFFRFNYSSREINKPALIKMRVHIGMEIGLRRRLGYNLLFYKFAGVQETVRKSYSVIAGSD